MIAVEMVTNKNEEAKIWLARLLFLGFFKQPNYSFHEIFERFISLLIHLCSRVNHEYSWTIPYVYSLFVVAASVPFYALLPS